MKIHLRGFAYSFIFGCLLLFASPEAKAQNIDTVVYDYGTLGSCYICASGYNCYSTPWSETLTGTNNRRLSKIKIKIFHTTCGSSGTFFARLNGDTLGTFTRAYSCSCSDCFVDSIEAGSAKLNSYVQNGSNTLNLGGLYLCTDKVMVIRTYASTATNDAGVLSVDSPKMVCAGTRNIVVSIGNFGRNRIDSVRVNWTWNGVSQSSYNYVGTLDTAGGSGSSKASFILGSKTLVNGKRDSLWVWTSLPNNSNDTVNTNDTIYTFIKPSLSGTLTIGGSNPNYATIQGAINDLQSYGVCGPVVFDIRSGVYNEQLRFGPIPGSDSIKNITFRSATGDSTAVSIYFSSFSSTDNYTVLLNNAKHIHFSKLTIESGGSSYAHVVELRTAFRYLIF